MTARKPNYLQWLSLIGIAFAAPAPGHAHDQWANGDPIPAWIKQACCGVADAHILGPDDYRIDAAGFHIKGINMVVPFDRILPSQDGKVWAFYPPGVGENASVYCVFYSGSI